MTLGRIFDPTDTGLLLAGGARRRTGAPVAFCQYVPAAGIDGYSLDLMRRDDGDHPNGLLDFVVVRDHPTPAAEQGARGSASTSPPCGPCWPARPGRASSPRIERWALPRAVELDADRVAVALQRQVRPRLAPRYVVYDAPGAPRAGGLRRRPGGVVLGAAGRSAASSSRRWPGMARRPRTLHPLMTAADPVLSVLDLAPVVPAARAGGGPAPTRSSWPSTPSASATTATGWPSTTTCPASPARRRPC